MIAVGPVFSLYLQVTIGNGVEKRGVIQAVWHSKTLQGKFPPGVLFDGNKLAWYVLKLPSWFHNSPR